MKGITEINLLELLLPQGSTWKVDRIYLGFNLLVLTLRSQQLSLACPDCQHLSERLHSTYYRHLKDLPWAEVEVIWHLKVRRLFCDNPNCSRRTFAERFGGIEPYVQRTQRRTDQLVELGLALGGEAGSRLSRRLNLTTSPDTLLNLVRQRALPEQPTPRVLGVDDWAWKKGQRYGTVLVDLERRCVVELLPDRKAETLLSWLNSHPGVEIVSRDRAGAYADAVKRGAPQALQVADRFHLYKGLSECVGRSVQRNYGVIQTALLTMAQLTTPTSLASGAVEVAPSSSSQVATATEAESSAASLPLKWHAAQKQKRFEYRMTLYRSVVELNKQGYNQQEIAQRLEISPDRVAVLLKEPPQLKQVIRASKLDPYKAYVRHRFFEEGCHNASAIWREICQQGYDGPRSSLIAYVTQLRPQLAVADERRTGRLPSTQPRVSTDHLHSARQITWWLMLEEAKLNQEQRAKLAGLCEEVAEIGMVRELVRGFRILFREKHEAGLKSWLEQAEQSGISELVSFARGIRRDEAAVRASIVSKWNNGPVEGFVNKIKLIKREMYGRAKFELLRARVLSAA